jgi:hypothetical protein
MGHAATLKINVSSVVFEIDVCQMGPAQNGKKIEELYDCTINVRVLNNLKVGRFLKLLLFANFSAIRI